MRIAVEYDDPSHFLRPPGQSGALVGPIDGKTRVRNTLIPRYITSLTAIPFYEWDEVSGDKHNSPKVIINHPNVNKFREVLPVVSAKNLV